MAGAARLVFFLFLAISPWLQTSRAVEPITVISLSLGALENLFSILDKFEAIESFAGMDSQSKKFIKEVRKINSRIQNLETQVSTGEATMKLILSKLNHNTRLELKMDELNDLVMRLTITHNRMSEYTKIDFSGKQREGKATRAEDETLLDFARWCVSHDTGSVVSMLERVHALLVPDANPDNFMRTGLLHLISRDMTISCEQTLDQVGLQFDMARTTQLFVALITFFFVAEAAYRAKPDELTPIDKLRLEFSHLVDELWIKVQDPRWNEVTTPEARGPDVAVAKAFKKFCDSLEIRFPRTEQQELQLESWVWSRMTVERTTVDELYESFKQFLEQQNRDRSPDRAWLDMAETVLEDPTHPIPDALEKIHSLTVHSNFLSHTAQESNWHVCNMRQSPSQLIYNMYNTIALTEIKGYIMMQFSYMLLKIYGKGSFSKEVQDMKKRFEDRTQLTVAAVKGALENTSRELWRCDPKEHINNETYVAMTRLLEGYIANEADISPDKQCWQNCDYYSVAKHHRCYDHSENCAVDPPCEGKILNCKYVDSDMWVCPAKSRDRRYDYIEYENKKVLGHKNNGCPHLRKVDSWWRYLFWHCSYCMCVCDDETRSDRYISMKELRADTPNNKVVTGLRFIKKRQVIYLQMSTGVLLENGKIDRASVKWEPVEDVDLERDVNGQDYYKFTYEERNMDLDLLEAPPGHLLTGVKFRKLGSHLNLEIMVTPFNFTTGKLTNPSLKSHWVSNDNTDVSATPRLKVYITNADVPTRSIAPSEVDSKTDQYVEFTHSGLDTDAAQSTIPFFDAQPVIPDYPIPLSGAGLYHKGQRGYGGFVGVKLFTYDFSQHMEAAFPQTDDVIINY